MELNILYTIIFTISTVTVIVGFLFAIRTYKIYGLNPILITALYLITSLLWAYDDTKVSDLLYDISLFVATLCVFKDKIFKGN